MPTNLSNVPAEQRVALSDDPIHAGRTASILISARSLPAVLTKLATANMFFAVTPYGGGIFSIACKVNRAHILVEAVKQAEKRK
jgi:hypothetical protein